MWCDVMWCDVMWCNIVLFGVMQWRVKWKELDLEVRGVMLGEVSIRLMCPSTNHWTRAHNTGRTREKYWRLLNSPRSDHCASALHYRESGLQTFFFPSSHPFPSASFYFFTSCLLSTCALTFPLLILLPLIFSPCPCPPSYPFIKITLHELYRILPVRYVRAPVQLCRAQASVMLDGTYASLRVCVCVRMCVFVCMWCIVVRGKREKRRGG